MSATGLETLEHTLQLTHEWINELELRLGWNDKARAFRLLKSVLHALRDCLIVEEAADFAAQLPMLLRGAYYEQWRPAAVPVKHRKKADFVAHVVASFKPDPLEHPTQAVMAVFELLNKKISTGEVDDIRHSLPEDLRTIWPERYREPGAVR